MKVGILTFHRAKNIGALLQAFALQHVVKNEFTECEIIDYRNEYIEEIYRCKSIKEVSSIKGLIKFLLTFRKNKEFEKIRADFISNYYNLSKKVYNKDNIEETNELYDIFITGSDQVWNPRLHMGDLNYYLKFVKDFKKRNSYAASLGSKDVELSVEIQNEIKNINHISVREEEGKKTIERFISNKKVEVVLDPTLLLSKEEWIKYAENEKLFLEEKYIFVYLIASTPKILDVAKKIAKEKNLKIICFHNGYRRYHGMKNLSSTTPFEFVNYIKNAEIVLTSSFHGMCFSVNLNKNFLFELDKNKENNNSRLVSLAKKLNLLDREIKDEKVNLSDINYDDVNERLMKIRNESLEFIKKLEKKND